MLVALVLCGLGTAWGETTYKLEKVTSVETGGLYVFEQSGHVMSNSISSSALQTTVNYQKTGLTGTEPYVWTLESSTNGFKMKNTQVNSNPVSNIYLSNSSSTSVTWVSSQNASVWSFSFDDDGYATISNTSNANRFLGYTNSTSHLYKAYAASNLSNDTYPHAIIVYRLVEETDDEPEVVATPTFSPAAGAVAAGTEVSISTTTKDAVIYYTTNGSTPSATNGIQGTTVTVNDEVTIKAIAVKDEYEDSEVAEASYTIKSTISGYVVDFENNLDEYVDWMMTNVERGMTNITSHGGTYYATTGGKTTASIATKNAIATPYILTCYVTKQSNNTTASNWKIQVSSDGSTWTDVATQSATSMSAGTWVEFSANLSDYKNVFVRVYYDGTTAIRNIDDLTLLTEIPTIPIINANTPSELACDATSGSISYEIVNYETGTMVATTDVDWIKDFTYQTSENGSVSFTSTANPTATSRSAIVTLTFTYGDNKTTTADITVSQDGNPNAPGTINTPYTVEQARAAIDAGKGTQGVYATGIVSEIVTAYDPQYGNISYNISKDGSTTADQLQAYRGKAQNGLNFTNADDIQVGDEVVIYGNLKKYNSTYEFDANNHLISLIRPEKPKHKVAFYQNGENLSEIDVEEGIAIEFPIAEETIYGKQFVGWLSEEIDGIANETSPVTAATMGTTDMAYYAVYAKKEGTTEKASVTIDKDTEGIPTSYGTANTFTEYSLNGMKFMIQQMYKNGDKLQWRAGGNSSGTGIMYNTDPFSNIQSIVLNYESSDTNKNFFVNVGNTANPTNGTAIEASQNEPYTYDCSAANCDYFVLTNGSGAGYLTSLTINYLKNNFTYSNYCTTVLPPVELAAPIIFHDGGEYEGALKVAMAGQGTIKYTLNGGAEQTYSAPINVSETTTITAWTESNGVKSDEVSKTFTIAAATAGPAVEDKYYTIKNNGNNKYVNVAGRKTVTFVDETATAAGTVIRVKADDKGQVQILRSQGVDIPGYAEKAMNYVPKIVELIVDKLHAEGSGELLGENGLDAIMAKFKESFDYHLYLEEANGGYRIYGRTPSMQPVVDFYAENKANVDAKLPGLEAFINSAIEKVLQKTNGSGASILVPFSLQTVWEKMGSTLTEPVDEASTAKFYEEVLSSEANVWNFAYETAMIYWSKLKAHPKFQENLDKLGDYAKYIDKVENIRPNFKYYIVQKNDQLDFISQGNSELNANFTTWTLAERTDFSVTFNISHEQTVCPIDPEDEGKSVTYTEYYTTLNTDFAYNVPEGVMAYQITGIGEIKGNETMGTVLKKKLNGTVPAQTPVLLVATEATVELELADDVEALSENKLYGNEYLIEKDELKNTMLKTLFETVKENYGEDLYNNYLKEYEHLMLLNSGTVNNKYFFNLSKDNDLAASNSYKSGMIMVLGQDDDLGVRFHYASNEDLKGNEAFMIDESNLLEDIVLTQKGDVNRDGKVDVADITALINIILTKATYPKDAEFYDFDAANVNGDGLISTPDLVALVNIILKQKTN